MRIKLCFDKEVHKLTHIPESLKSLVQSIHRIFKESLPQTWGLKYLDADGDRVMLTTEDEFKLMIESHAESLKIFVDPSFDGKFSDPKTEPEHISNSNSSQSDHEETKEEGRVSKAVKIFKKLATEQICTPGRVSLNNKLTELYSGMNSIEKFEYEIATKQTVPKRIPKKCEDKPKCKEADIEALVKQYIDSNMNGIVTFVKSQMPSSENDEKVLTLVNKMVKIFRDLGEDQKKQLDDILDGIPSKLQKLTTKKKPSAKKPPVKPKAEVKKIDISETPGQQTLEEPKILEQKEKFDIQFIKELSSVPERPTKDDKIIYKTIVVKNSGKEVWPKNCELVNTTQEVIQSEKKQLIPVQAEKEITIILSFKNPGNSGKFLSNWRLSYIDESGMTQLIGKPMDILIQIFESQKQEDETRLLSKYPTNVISKAKQLKEIFSESDLTTLLEFVLLNQDQSIDSLANNYIV